MWRVLEALEPDQLLEARVDPVMRVACASLFVYAVKVGAVAPSADHDELTRVAVRLPDLEVDQAVYVVDEVRFASGRQRSAGARRAR